MTGGHNSQRFGFFGAKRSGVGSRRLLHTAVCMLLDNRVQSTGTTLGVASVLLLAFAMSGILEGWRRTTSAIVRNADADLWVVAEQVPAFDYGNPIPADRVWQARSVPGVAQAAALLVGFGSWTSPLGRHTVVGIVGLDDDHSGAPWRMVRSEPAVVDRPDSVVIDCSAMSQLDIRQVGDEGQVSRRPAIVRGLSAEVRTFTATPWVFASLDTARQYDTWHDAEEITYVLVRCAEGADVPTVRHRLQACLPHVEVVTSGEFARRTTRFWLLETGAGATVVLTAVLSLIVGVIVVSLSVFVVVSSHRESFAVLLAVGFRRWQLVQMVAFQAVVASAASVAIAGAGYLILARFSAATPMPLELTLTQAAVLTGLFVTCCVMASLISVRSVFRIDPIAVFQH